jgi:hypothetical protein
MLTGPSAFDQLRSRAISVASQVEEALLHASPEDQTVADLFKIRWKQRSFVLESAINKKASRGRRSWIGAHGWFLVELGPHQTAKSAVWACRRCDEARKPQFFVIQSTTSAADHLKKEHRVSPNEGIDGTLDTSDSVLDLQFAAAAKRPATEPIPRARMAKIRELAVGYIVNADLPFTTMTDPFIRELLEQLNKPVASEASLGRSTIVSDLEKIYLAKRAIIQQELFEASTAIHFSFDLWSSPNNLAVIAIFAHFLDRSHRRCNRLLAFQQHSGRHNGENIAQTIRDVIYSWRIQERVGVAICDNVSSNDTCLQALYPSLDASLTEEDVKMRRMRCLGHILNLTAKAFLFGSDADAFERQSDAFQLLDQLDDDLQHWRRKGPVGKLHNIVKFIRASPQRLEDFRNALQDLSSVESPTEDIILTDLSPTNLELIQNNATRWNSTYLMIHRAWKLHAKIQTFLANHDMTATPSTRLPEADRLSIDDWRLLGELEAVLKPIYDLTLQAEGGGGALWMVLTQMEFLLEHFEQLKVFYDNLTSSEVEASVTAGHNLPLDPTLMSTEDSLEIRASRRLRERSSQRARAAATATARFNERALPPYTRASFTHSSTEPNALGLDQRAYMRVSINHAWVKLNQYYTILSESPLFAAAVILHPKYGLKWLEKKWTTEEQLVWLRDAKHELEIYLERYYPPQDDLQVHVDERRIVPAAVTRRERQHYDSRAFDEWLAAESGPDGGIESELDEYLKLRPDRDIEDPIQWWVDRKKTFPRLSRLALDLLAVPAMSDDCERQFSLAKLSVSSQRARLLPQTLQFLQLIRSWLRHGAIKLGGVGVS